MISRCDASKHRNFARLFLVGCALFIASDSPGQSPAPQGGAPGGPREIRTRRIIFDNDGNEPHFLKELTAEDVLQQRTAALAGTQVDTLFYCANDAFGSSKRPSKVWQLFNSKGGIHARNRVVELANAGVDILRVMVGFGHKNHMEVFANVRMNDVHDGGRAADDVIRFKDNQFKTQHPEYLVGKINQRTKTGSWSAVNYALPEVREHMFRYLEESCRDYDIDGLELDFFRHPCFFKATYLGKPCGDEERAAMTELIRRTREMMNEIGKKRGRPLLLSVRVPDSVGYCRAIGLDIEHWLESAWVDLLVVTSYFQLGDWGDSVALGRKYRVPVYPSLDEARSKNEEVLAARMTMLAYRGRAAAAWGAGMDGIMLFNQTDPASAHWRELGDARALEAMDKDYFASVRGLGKANGGNLSYEAWLTGESLHPDNPRPVPAGKAATAKIRLGAMRADEAKCTLRLRFAHPADIAALRVEMDGAVVESLHAEGDWVEAALPVAAFKLAAPALHEVKVALRDGAAALSWLDLMVTERHAAGASAGGKGAQ